MYTPRPLEIVEFLPHEPEIFRGLALQGGGDVSDGSPSPRRKFFRLDGRGDSKVTPTPPSMSEAENIQPTGQPRSKRERGVEPGSKN
ncbi:hypothetical protein PGTUg99_035756 [Puccinia graminis f. sp. tritici]|uniref:Uncharacterized protein n=1 Tax=Puccinia graminis f. sp. tritici TaxID=56615 RepID=A0A5B0SL89_PUCGR|nr:hypothetical protein PGTUg99_035756 [Puccinia graminis f. sp. tritici]